MRIALAAKAFWYVLRGHQVIYRGIIGGDTGVIVPDGERALVAETKIRNVDTAIYCDRGYKHLLVKDSYVRLSNELASFRERS